MMDSRFLEVMVVVCFALLVNQSLSRERTVTRIWRLEAKVDALLQQAGVSFDPFANVPPEVQEALNRGETIVAIKRLRKATPLGLKEAREFVDELRRRSASSTRG